MNTLDTKALPVVLPVASVSLMPGTNMRTGAHNAITPGPHNAHFDTLFANLLPQSGPGYGVLEGMALGATQLPGGKILPPELSDAGRTLKLANFNRSQTTIDDLTIDSGAGQPDLLWTTTPLYIFEHKQPAISSAAASTMSMLPTSRQNLLSLSSLPVAPLTINAYGASGHLSSLAPVSTFKTEQVIGESKSDIGLVFIDRSVMHSDIESVPASERKGLPLTSIMSSVVPMTTLQVLQDGYISQSPALTLPMEGRAWEQVLGQRIQWMVGQQVHEAHIQLNPRELGPMTIRVTVDGSQTHIVFAVHHADVKEMLESALPRLREWFDDGRQSLSHVEVQDQSAQSNTHKNYHDNRVIAKEYMEERHENETHVIAQSHVADDTFSLIDYYA